MKIYEFKNTASCLSKTATLLTKAMPNLGSQSMKNVPAQEALYDLRSCSCTSEKNLVDAFESVEFALRQPIEGRNLTIRVFPAENRIVATTIWNENIKGFPPSYHQLDVSVQFIAAGESATKAKVKWTALDFPRGHFTNQVVRRVNTRIAMVLKAELRPEHHD
ncbi:MAG TPA: hypothetical protein V6C97_33050 [Oculatellaceae cyanobacterium]